MTEPVIHIIPSPPTFKDYAYRLWIALTNQPDVIVFSKATVRKMFKQAYPKAKV